MKTRELSEDAREILETLERHAVRAEKDFRRLAWVVRQTGATVGSDCWNQSIRAHVEWRRLMNTLRALGRRGFALPKRGRAK